MYNLNVFARVSPETFVDNPISTSCVGGGGGFVRLLISSMCAQLFCNEYAF